MQIDVLMKHLFWKCPMIVNATAKQCSFLFRSGFMFNTCQVVYKGVWLRFLKEISFYRIVWFPSHKKNGKYTAGKSKEWECIIIRYLNLPISKNTILFWSIKMILKTNTRSFAWCQNNTEIQRPHKWLATIWNKDVCVYCINALVQIRLLILELLPCFHK